VFSHDAAATAAAAQHVLLHHVSCRLALQILKWALVASAQETSSLLIDKGKRDGAAWVAAMELEPLGPAEAAAAE